MADPYASARATAARLLAKKGAVVTFTRPTGAAGVDPITQAPLPTLAPLKATTRAVELPPGPSATFRVGGLVDEKMREFFIAYPMTPASFEAQEGDVVTWADGRAYTLVNVLTYRPDGGGAVLSRALAKS